MTLSFMDNMSTVFRLESEMMKIYYLNALQPLIRQMQAQIVNDSYSSFSSELIGDSGSGCGYLQGILKNTALLNVSFF